MIYKVTMRNYFISYYHKKNRTEYLHDQWKNAEIPNITWLKKISKIDTKAGRISKMPTSLDNINI